MSLNKNNTDATFDAFVKSPINYTGGKHKLMPKLYTNMPKDMDDGTFIDLFGGGGTVVANAPECFSHLIYNEINKEVLSLVKMLAEVPGEEIARHIDGRMAEYGLSRNEDGAKEAYIVFREYYNSQDDETRDPKDLLTLVAHSFSNQIRFNRSGEFNIPFGKRTFNDKMRDNLHSFATALRSRDFSATCSSFSAFDFTGHDPKKTFIYCDPPYLGSVATYNEQGGWTEDDEKALLLLLDELDDAGYKWMLSNNFEYDNPILKRWASNREHYTVIDLDYDYRTCNYHKKKPEKKKTGGSRNDADDRGNGLTEVAIVNYSLNLK